VAKPGVSDSLFVGESANKGTPAKWDTKALDGRALPLPWDAAFPIRGFEFYDGPVFTTKSHFEGFTPNKQRQASALSTLRFTAFPMSPRNWTSGLSFGAGVNRVHAETRPAPKPKESENGYRTAVFFDRDGTVTGTARRYVVMNSPLLLTSRCTRVAAWNSSVCDDTFAATSFWTRAGDHPGSLTLTRDDGAAHTMMWGGDYEHTNLPANRRYTVSFGGHQPRQLSIMLGAINLADRGGKGARWVRYAIPVGGGVRVEPDHGRPAPSRVASSAALDASTEWAAYYVEGGTLHLRLRATKPAEWLSVRVTR
jgi:cell migration-inducing and hyaluronan-binding protein